MTDSDASVEIVRWYTRARRFPQLIGRTPDGTQIPFGPFTFTQVIGIGVFLFVAVKTVDLWGQFGLIGNVFVGATATFGIGFALGRIPIGARNPLSLAVGTLNAFTAPHTGTVSGRPVRTKAPHRVHSEVVIHHLTDDTTTPPVAATSPELLPTPSADDLEPSPAQPTVTSPPLTSPPLTSPDVSSSAAPPTTDDPAPAETPVSPRRSGRPLTGVQRLLSEGPSRNRRAA